MKTKLETGKFCYDIVESSKDENGYIPVVVVENEPGYSPMLGNGPFATPWYWGHDFNAALKIAADVNEKMGITPERAKDIIASSFAAQRRVS
jgi:hypothetical protein